jgi:tRNA-dihydrouridine synthase
MLAPMQGVTNRALRGYFVEQVRPDVIFTEFMRVNNAPAGMSLSAADQRDISAEQDGVPLVVQLVGHGREALVAAAQVAQDTGAAHINLNMGCPYGRMGGGKTGGGMLSCPDDLAQVIPALREAVTGSFSVKIRAGYDDPEQIMTLLPLFEGSGVDFLVLHPRTVVQKYEGSADHGVTARVVQATRLPVIANGDIRNTADGVRLLEESGAAGLMLGRGAIADPLLFRRLRGEAVPVASREARRAELDRYLREIVARYRQLFCGESQVLNKVKEIIAYLDEPDLAKSLKELRRAKTIAAFEKALLGLW